MPDIRSVLPALAMGVALPSFFALASDDVAGKQQRPAHRLAAAFGTKGYPNFDCRYDDKGQAQGFVTEGLARVMTPEVAAAVAADEARLRELVPGVYIDHHPALGLPVNVASPSGYLSEQAENPLQALAPEAAVKQFLTRFAGMVQIGSEELDRSHLFRNFVTDHNGVQHLSWQQQIGGIDLVGCELRGSVAADGRLISIGTTMLPRPQDDFVTSAVRLSALEALRIAAANVGITFAANPVAAAPADPEAADATQERAWIGAAELRTDVAVTTKRVYFAKTRDDIRPAWAVVLPTPGVGHTYDTIVDAVDGTILQRSNRLVWDTTQPVTYRIFTSDSPAPGSPGNATPNGFQFPFDTPQVVTVQPDDIRAISPNGWIPDNQSETLGNNCDVHADRNGDNAPDLPRPNGGPMRDFSSINTYSPTANPTAYTNFAVVQMFYWANLYHDRLWSLGFNEAAGNFQTDNFGRGGVGGDPVQCDAQDGSGTNNANWQGTGVDGTANRVQMYIFPASTIITDRDGTLDGDVVFHELTHGTSTRLHHGLNGTQPRSMGEGWSDFFGITMLAQPGDNPDGNYCVGGYVTYGFPDGAFVDNYYFGIRRFPYSTNTSVNPQTFADADPGQQSYPAGIPRSPIIGLDPADEVHNMGEVWCNTLLEARAALWRLYGFAGNEQIMRLTIDAMKLVNSSEPTMLMERTAILQSDTINNGRVNVIPLWRAFARRGMGASAISTSAQTTVGIVEAYDVPQRVIFTYPSPLPSQMLPGQSQNFTVEVAPLNLTITPNTGRLFYSVNGGAFQSVAMVPDGATRYTATLPASACLDRLRYYVDVDTNVGRFQDPEGGASMANAVQVFTGIDASINDTAETNLGWTIVTTASAGAWQRGVPRNLNRGDPPADSDDAGANCWLTQNGPLADSDVDTGSTTMTSPAFSALDGDILSYAYWLNSTQAAIGAGDGFFTEIATDVAGTNWLRVRSVTAVSNTWRTERMVVGRDIPPSSTMRIRFVATDVTPPGNIVEAALDNFRLERLVCVDNCPADFNHDGGVDGADVEAFYLVWIAGDSAADVNHDGGVDGADVEAFFVPWQAGGC